MPHLLTLLAHSTGDSDSATGAVVPPVHFSTTYERAPDGAYPHGYIYSREANPTRARLEKALASIEGGHEARAFSSGLAASDAVLQSLPPGARVVIPEDVYHGFRELVVSLSEAGRIQQIVVDTSDADQVEVALDEGADLVWLETPSNPLLRVSDIARLARMAHSYGATLAVDGTWTTPVLQRPFDLGADVVIHSLTKYMAGHSDVLGGAVVVRQDGPLAVRIAERQRLAGAVLDPFSCWLTLRGLRSLGVRIAHQSAGAARIASFLEDHQNVESVFYPGLESHRGHETARGQMAAYGAMVSFTVHGDDVRAMAVAARTRVFTRATSLGGTESLIEHRASMEGPDTATPANLLRLSIGLEHVDDLVEDLEQALTQS